MKYNLTAMGILAAALSAVSPALALTADTDAVQSPAVSAASAVKTCTEASPLMAAANAGAYDQLLARYYNLISNRPKDWDPRDGEVGVWEVARSKTRSEALSSIGYAVRDISGDGIPELIIGEMIAPGAEGPRSHIYSIYTLVNGKPKNTIDASARNNWHLMEYNKLLNQGSGGASLFIFSTNKLTQDGTSTVCSNNYFSHWTGEGGAQNVNFWHNTTGECETSKAERMNISEDAFWKILSDLSAKTVDAGLTPFSKYTAANQAAAKSAAGAPARLKASFAKDFPGGGSGCRTFTADSSAPVKVIFSSQGTLKNFKVLKLEMKDYSNGKPVFNIKELHNAGSVDAQNPLAVVLSFPGDLPSYGVSYVDGTGNTHRFAISLSGKDGSLVTSEF